MIHRFAFLLLPFLSIGCGWFGDDLPPKTRCHKAGRIPYEDLRPVGAEEGGDSVWIRGNVPGVTEGQVRFHEEIEGELTLICLGVVCDGQFEVEAPPESDAPIHISIVELAEGETVDGSHRFGLLEAPVYLKGSDVQVDIQLGETADWAKRLSLQPDKIAQRSDVFHREAPPPP